LKQTKLHMIGHGHIDPVWLWRWPEGFQEVKATFRSVLDRMNEYDDFIFTCSSAAFYAFVEENDPEMFAEIRRRVREGRWVIVGGWWVEPDCNIPGGESFVRQGLYGQRYFHSRFGVIARTGFNPDSFGHAATLPQILKKSGMDFYTFMRPGPHEKGLPGRLFWWESNDGSRVLAFRIPFEYLTWSGDIEKHVRKCEGEAKEPFNEIMCFYGVGNHGGGPTKANLDSIRRMNGQPDFPELVMSSPDRFFREQLGRDLPVPVVHDELQHHASGCYAAHSAIKRWNRKAENLLLTAEKFSALAQRLTGQPYPTDFERAWRGVLFNQFHDILAGTALEEAYDDARDLYGEAMAIGARALNHAIQSIAWRVQIDHVEGSQPVVVFNPHAWPARLLVEMETGGLKEQHVLLDDQGNPVPFQFVRSHATVTGWRRRVAFVADLPAMGYRTYRFVRQEEPGPSFPEVGATDTVLENARFRLEIDPETGCIKQLLDKKANFAVIAGGGARPAVIHDPSDTWSHGVCKFEDEVGSFAPTRVRLIEHGPVKATIRVESAWGSSKLIQDFSLYRELERIDVAVTVDWREQQKMLKLRFPTSLHFPRATYEIPYGHIERPANGEEEPGQSWIDLTGVVRGTDALYGLSLLNDGKYSFSVRDREMSLTVLRSPIYAHHDPYVPTPDGIYTYMDQGVQRFTYSLLPHEGSWEQAGTVRRAAELNQPAVALPETSHAGPLPPAQSLLAVDAPNVVVSVVKKAEDGDDLVVRAYETDRVATRATIRIPLLGREFDVRFGPCEIKTFRVPADPAAPVVETNLLEWVEA